MTSWDNPTSALRETRLVAVPPGEYRVRIGIYDRTNSQRLKVRCSHTDACAGDAVDVAPLGSGPQQ